MPPRSIFRAALCCGFLVLAFSGCGKRTNGGPLKVRLATDWYPQPEHGGYYNALVRGYYAAAGLDVEILPGNPGDSADRRVTTGNAEFGMSDTDGLLLARERGLPIIALTTTLQHSPQAIMVRADSPVKTFADLSNHRVAVAPGVPWFRYLTDKYHLQNVQEIPLNFNIANFIHDPSYIQQAFITSEPYFVRKQGVEPRMLPIRDSGYDPYRILMSNRSFVAAHPAAVRSFVEASLRGWREYLQDPSAANAHILKLNPEMKPELMTFSWQALKDGHFIDGFPDKGEAVGQMTAARWQAQYDILKKINVLQTTFDPKEAYTLEYFPKP